MFGHYQTRFALRKAAFKPVKRQASKDQKRLVTLAQAAIQKNQDDLLALRKAQPTLTPGDGADWEKLNLLAEAAAGQPKSILKHSNPWAGLRLLADTALGLRPIQKVSFKEPL